MYLKLYPVSAASTTKSVRSNSLEFLKKIKNNFLQEMEDYIQSIDDKDDLTVKKRKTSLLGK